MTSQHLSRALALAPFKAKLRHPIFNRVAVAPKLTHYGQYPYTQMYAQVIFSPKGRENLILPSFEERIYKYISGVVKDRGQKLIAINGMPDHLHLFIGFKPSIAIADLVKDIKTGTTKFINSERFLPWRFAWQDGYGCFTYSHSQVDMVAQYVMNQKQHHRSKTFSEEYMALLQKFEVAYDDGYLFEYYD